jgi:outer membrane protein OmpA-like peptidoglycan-associated protein
MRRSAIIVLSALLASGNYAAFAQGSPQAGSAKAPSTQEIIKSLTPTGNDMTTRGIRLARPGEQQQPSTPRAATAATAEAPSVNLMVLFPTNSAELTPEATQTLDRLGQALNSQQLSSFRFRIEGHTDTVGSAAYNRSLSQRRADSVVSYLEQKFGIPAARLKAVGLGEQGLLVSTGAQVAEPRNRRVQVVNLGS